VIAGVKFVAPRVMADRAGVALSLAAEGCFIERAL